MIRFFLIILALQVSLSSCSQDGRVLNSSYGFVLNTLLDHSVPELAVGEVDQTAGYVYLDARAKEEFEVSHLANAIWVGYDDFDPKRLEGINPSDTLLVYCSIGYRSEKVAEQIKALGFDQVYNLYGGIFEWKNQGRAVVDMEDDVTDKVHAFDKNWGRWLNAGEKVYE